MEVASLFNTWLVSGCEQKVFRVFHLSPRKTVRDAKSFVATILLLKTYQKWFLCYHLPCRFKVLMCLLFCMQRRILRKSLRKYSFLLFSQKCRCQHFCWDSRLIISKKCVGTPLFVVDSNSPWKYLLFPHGPNLMQKPLYLVGTVFECLTLSAGKYHFLVPLDCSDNEIR